MATKYNHMYDVAFSLETDVEDPYEVPLKIILNRLEARVRDLYRKIHLVETREAFGHVDTYEVEE